MLFLHMRSRKQDITMSVPPHPPALTVQPPMPHAVPLLPVPHQIVFPHHAGVSFPGFPESFHPDERLQYWENQDREMSGQESEATRIEVDESAYLEGWRDAIKGIWQTISPVLS